METDHIFLLVYANNLFFVMVYGNVSAGSNISRLVANMLMDWTSQMSKCVAAGCELNPVAAYICDAPPFIVKYTSLYLIWKCRAKKLFIFKEI